MYRYLLLGLLQGLTEFLPVSSSGHLVLTQRLLGVDPPGLALEGVVHLATMVAVAIYFRSQLWRLLSRAACGQAERRYLGLLLLAALPAGIVGLLLANPLEVAFSSLHLTGGMFFLTASFLGLTQLRRGGPRPLGIRHALAMGLKMCIRDRSKRHGAVSVLEYRRRGFLPEALINFFARLGWSHGDQEIFSREELIELFDLPGVGKSAAVFDEQKLLWINHEWLKRSDLSRLTKLLSEYIVQEGIAPREEVEALGEGKLRRAAELLRERNKTLVAMAQAARFLFPGELSVSEETRRLFTPELAEPLEKIAAALEACADFSPEGVEQAVRAKLEELGLPLKAVAQPIRVAVTGRTVSPGLFDVISLAGRESAVARLRRAAQWCLAV
ncbi:MAG TPA: hypothetical protein ENI38_01485 [Candidatus Acetothermia bacterium]|nr:hypothetical protein [Candidatus Acetothermia bacterium]